MFHKWIVTTRAIIYLIAFTISFPLIIVGSICFESSNPWFTILISIGCSTLAASLLAIAIDFSDLHKTTRQSRDRIEELGNIVIETYAEIFNVSEKQTKNKWTFDSVIDDKLSKANNFPISAKAIYGFEAIKRKCRECIYRCDLGLRDRKNIEDIEKNVDELLKNKNDYPNGTLLKNIKDRALHLEAINVLFLEDTLVIVKMFKKSSPIISSMMFNEDGTVDYDSIEFENDGITIKRNKEIKYK